VLHTFRCSSVARRQALWRCGLLSLAWLNARRFARSFHAARYVNSIAEDVVDKLILAHDACHDWSRMNTDTQLPARLLRQVYLSHFQDFFPGRIKAEFERGLGVETVAEVFSFAGIEKLLQRCLRIFTGIFQKPYFTGFGKAKAAEFVIVIHNFYAAITIAVAYFHKIQNHEAVCSDSFDFIYQRMLSSFLIAKQQRGGEKQQQENISKYRRDHLVSATGLFSVAAIIFNPNLLKSAAFIR
jgi:hypothetical protein